MSETIVPLTLDLQISHVLTAFQQACWQTEESYALPH